MPPKKRLSLAQAVEEVQRVEKVQDDSDLEEFDCLEEACDRVADSQSGYVDVILLPPETVDAVSDEEEFNDDDLDRSQMPRDVPGRVVVQFRNEYYSDDDTPLADHPVSKSRKVSSKLNSTIAPKWTKKIKFEQSIPSTTVDCLSDVHPELASNTPYELFKLFCTDEIIQQIVTESMRYAGQKNDVSFAVTTEDIETFVGILLLSGYHSLPRERMYWNRDEDVKIPFVSSCMSRNRFSHIKKYLHLANNDSVDATDKMFKVRPLIKLLNERLQQFGIFSQYLSIDEEMVPYFGRHSSKMFIRGKPIRFGFKLWVLASDDGYPYHVIVYCGKNRDVTQQEEFGLGHRVVTSLLQCLTKPDCHEVYFDNFFTSYDLLVHLRNSNIKATGTVRENRLRKCPLMDSKSMKKKDRGIHDAQSDSKVVAVKWYDNQCVTLASNFQEVTPMGKARRWCAAKKGPVDIPQPALIGSYNAHMGGVDLLDRFLSSYRPIFRAKKWWWPLFLNCINCSSLAYPRCRRREF